MAAELCLEVEDTASCAILPALRRFHKRTFRTWLALEALGTIQLAAHARPSHSDALRRREGSSRYLRRVMRRVTGEEAERLKRKQSSFPKYKKPGRADSA